MKAQRDSPPLAGLVREWAKAHSVLAARWGTTPVPVMRSSACVMLAVRRGSSSACSSLMMACTVLRKSGSLAWSPPFKDWPLKSVPPRVGVLIAACRHLARVWNEWRAQRATCLTNGVVPVTTPLLEMPPVDLSYWMGKFVLEVRKKGGSEYPPNSLYALVCCFKRFMNTMAFMASTH